MIKSNNLHGSTTFFMTDNNDNKDVQTTELIRTSQSWDGAELPEARRPLHVLPLAAGPAPVGTTPRDTTQ